MDRDVLLLSIKPRYVDRIFEGTKRVELRKARPRIRPGALVLIYATCPVKAFVGAFRADAVRMHAIADLWSEVRSCAGVSREEFYAYYGSAPIGVGIFFTEVIPFDSPIDLAHVRERWPGFQPPQGYLYVPSDFVRSPIFPMIPAAGPNMTALSQR